MRYTRAMKKVAPDEGAEPRTQVNVRLPKRMMGELMRLGGYEQASTGVRITQQDLVERAVGDYVVKLRSKYEQDK